MKKEKTRITSHRFIGNECGSYTYEISFNKSLEDTVRMDAMCSGLDRYDRMRPFWSFVHHMIAYPLLITNSKWAYRFYRQSGNRM